MKELIPRQQFDIAIQAAIGNHIIARSTVKQLRKTYWRSVMVGMLAVRKTSAETKDGKKRMKQVGNVELPQEAFLAILHVGKDSK